MKRTVALFLAILMTCSLIPAPAPAAEAVMPPGEEAGVVLAPDTGTAATSDPADPSSGQMPSDDEAALPGNGAEQPPDEAGAPDGEEAAPAEGAEKPVEGAGRPAGGEGTEPSDAGHAICDKESGTYTKTEPPPELPNVPAPPEYVRELDAEPEGETPSLLDDDFFYATETANITSGGSILYYSWKPRVSGRYIFESTNDGDDTDTYGYLYDSDWNLLTTDDDGGDRQNFRITYDFVAGNTYCFGVRWYSSSKTGPITLCWRSALPTAVALDASIAATQGGVSAAADIDIGGDVRYFSITPARTGTYIFESTNTSGDTYAYLYNSDWSLLTANDDGGTGSNFRITYSLTAGTTYYYGVRWYSSTTTGNISFCLRMQVTVTVLEPAVVDSVGGASCSAYLENGAIAYYSFQPTQGGSYVFESVDNTQDTYAYLYASDWSQLAYDDDGGEGRNFKLTCSLTAGNTYYFGAKWYSSSTSGTLNVNLRRQEEERTVVPFTPGAVSQESGETMTRSVAQGECVYFSFTPEVSGSYVFGSDTQGDTYGYLYDPDWTQLAHDDDGSTGRNFKIICVLTAGSTYYFGARWYSSSKSGEISVNLTMRRDVRVIEIDSAFENSYTGDQGVGAGEDVYFSFTPTKTEEYVFESVNTSGDTFCVLYNSDWGLLASDDDGGEGRNFRLRYELSAGATYYYGVRWYSSSQEGTISVLLRRAQPELPDTVVLNANAASTQTGTAAAAEVGDGETAYFSVVPVGSGTYIFESNNASGRVEGRLYDMTDAGLRELAGDTGTSSGHNCKIEYELTAGVTYYYGVKWQERGAKDTISVILRKQATAPALQAGVAATANITTGGVQAHFSFTPGTAGIYTFESTVGQDEENKDTCGYLYDANMRQLSSNDDGGNGLNFRIDYSLEANKTYYYGVKWYSAAATGDIPVILNARTSDPYTALTVSSTFNETSCANISTAGDVVYYIFQPVQSGDYVFESVGSGDTQGDLYDDKWQLIDSNDDGGSGLNFRIVRYLDAENTYYYGVRWHSSSKIGEINVCLRRQFTVTFNAGEGGSVSPESKTVVNGDSYGSLPTPAGSGGTFAGWFTSSSGGSRITGPTTVRLSGDQVLYAQWVQDVVTVTFDPVGGSVAPSTKTVTRGKSYGELPAPVCSGYRFTGWYTRADSGGSQVDGGSLVASDASDHTLYARWELAAVDPTGISVTLQANTIQVGGKTTAAATVSPSNASNKAVTWSSGNAGVATVDSSGNITGVGAGSTTITATSVADSRVSGSQTVTVQPPGGGKVSGYDPDFFYQFWNTETSFSRTGNYRIPVERYMQLGFPQAQANALYQQNGAWGGSCFGFATSSILFYKDVLQEEGFDPDAKVPHDFDAPNGNTTSAVRLRSMIELLQVSQIMPGNGGYSGYNQPKFDAQAVAAQIDQGDPVKLGIRSSAGGHAVVIYDYIKTGNTYHFDIYDNSDFVSALSYTPSESYEFSYNTSRYKWYVNNYCTYDTIKGKHDQLTANNSGADKVLHPSLLDLNEGKTYTYLFCPGANMTITDAQGHTCTVTDHELGGDMPEIQFILSEVPLSSDDDSGETAQPSYIIIFPTGEYTITGPTQLYLAGQEIGVQIDDLTAGTSVTAAADLKKIDIRTAGEPGPDVYPPYSVTYLTYGDLFEKIQLTGDTLSGDLTTALYEDRVDITGANLVRAQAFVSGKPAGVESFTQGRETVSVQWLELENGNVTLWIGDLLQNGSDKEEKPGYWLENGVASNKDAILAERSQLALPVASIEGKKYASGQTLTFTQGQTLTFTKDNGAWIYYTTDGSTPSEDNGEFYPGFIEINRSMKVRAIAVRDGYLPSEVVELDFKLPEVGKPAANYPDDQDHEGTLYVELFSASSDAVIYYTLDGTDPLAPTSSPERYNCLIPISVNTVLSAVAVEKGCVSEVARYTYHFAMPVTVNATKLLGEDGQVLNSGQLSRLEKIELTVSNAEPAAMDVVFTVAFYTGDGQLVCLTSGIEPVGEGVSTVVIPVRGDAGGAERVKIFMTDRSYQPLGYYVET